MGHFLLTKVCLLIKHGPLHNPLRGRQTLQPTPLTGEFGTPLQAVSILYEADRLCNFGGLRFLTTITRFQSSTRQTDFATLAPAGYRYLARVVSILYEADRLCNASRAPMALGVTMFQSSTRQTDFAT